MTDGEKIRSHRDRLGWTQAEAASHLGMSRRAYIDAEQDARSRPLRRYELAGILALFERAPRPTRSRLTKGGTV